MSNYYAGIGARSAPEEALQAMRCLAESLRTRDWVLRSGGADGSDKAFEAGAGSAKEIMTPKNMGMVRGPINMSHHWAVKLISPFCLEYPIEQMKPYVQALLARNAMIVVGAAGDSYVDFVACWTPTDDPCDPLAGGTRYACRLAKSLGIPVYNLRNSTQAEEFLSSRFYNKE